MKLKIVKLRWLFIKITTRNGNYQGIHPPKIFRALVIVFWISYFKFHNNEVPQKREVKLQYNQRYPRGSYRNEAKKSSSQSDTPLKDTTGFAGLVSIYQTKYGKFHIKQNSVDSEPHYKTLQMSYDISK